MSVHAHLACAAASTVPFAAHLCSPFTACESGSPGPPSDFRLTHKRRPWGVAFVNQAAYRTYLLIALRPGGAQAPGTTAQPLLAAQERLQSVPNWPLFHFPAA